MNFIKYYWILLLLAGHLQAAPLSGLECRQAIPDAGIPILPHTSLSAYPESTEFRVVATRGEYEPISFVLRSDRPIGKLEFQLENLEGPNGSIPRGQLDLRVVKCWYQAGTAWNDVLQQRSSSVLIPELLLHDADLVRVDDEKQENFLRLDFAEGAEYRSISGQEQQGLSIYTTENIRSSEFPVRDAAELQPLALPADFNQQFLLTVHVPEDAVSGVYSGTITVWCDEQEAGKLELQLRVLPFNLAEPATRYDSSKSFYPGFYLFSTASEGEGAITPFARNWEQVEAEYRNLANHGVTYAGTYQQQKNSRITRNPEVDIEFRRILELRRECGMATRPVFLNAPENNLHVALDSSADGLAFVASRVREITDIVEDVYGHRDIYFYGVDEAEPEMVRQQKLIWDQIHRDGGRVFTSGTKQHTFQTAGDILDLLVCGGPADRREAANWHENGHMIWIYGHPQTAVENPEVYRRNYGLLTWLNDYDGSMPFVYYCAYGNPWNDFDGMHRDIGIVYPTVDGVIDTLAWEAYREAIDDIRYATTLQHAIRDAKPDKQAIADEAANWLDTLEVYSVPALTIRLTMIDYIMKIGDFK